MPKPVLKQLTFAELRDAYLETRSNGVIEENSLDTIKLHLRHLAATYGEKYPIAKITQADVQRHVDRRLKQKYRGEQLARSRHAKK